MATSPESCQNDPQLTVEFAHLTECGRGVDLLDLIDLCSVISAGELDQGKQEVRTRPTTTTAQWEI